MATATDGEAPAPPPTLLAPPPTPPAGAPAPPWPAAAGAMATATDGEAPAPPIIVLEPTTTPAAATALPTAGAPEALSHPSTPTGERRRGPRPPPRARSCGARRRRAGCVWPLVAPQARAHRLHAPGQPPEGGPAHG